MISAPKSATACNLISGVVNGMTTTAGIPRVRARKRDTLRVIAGRGADDAALRADRRQLRDLVVGTANFERKHRLQVFTFEQDAIVQTARQPRCGFQRRLDGDIVDFCLEDPIYVVFRHLTPCWRHLH